MRPILYSVLAVFCLALPLAACDDQQQTSSSSALPGSVETSSGLAEGEGAGTDTGTGTGSDADVSAEAPQSDVPPPSREMFSDASCGFDAWVGKPLAGIEAAAKETGRPVRILTPESMMTMDHAPDRINVVHEDGNVTRVWCG